jgi:hypothetical protein
MPCPFHSYGVYHPKNTGAKSTNYKALYYVNLSSFVPSLLPVQLSNILNLHSSLSKIQFQTYIKQHINYRNKKASTKLISQEEIIVIHNNYRQQLKRKENS